MASGMRGDGADPCVKPYHTGMGRRAAVLALAAVLLGTAANALHPRGLSWSRPLGAGLRARAAEAGIVPVDLEVVRKLLRTPGVVFLDSRPSEEFEIGALPGARSLPWNRIEEGGSPPGPPAPSPIVVYCANEWCESSLELGRWLKSKGHRDVALFVDGYEAWWNAGGSDVR